MLSARFTVVGRTHAHRVSVLLRLPSERGVKDDWCCSLCVNVISFLATSAHLTLMKIPVELVTVHPSVWIVQFLSCVFEPDQSLSINNLRMKWKI